VCVERFAACFARDFRAALEPVSDVRLREVLVAADQGGYNPRRARDLLENLSWRDAPDASALEAHWQSAFPLATVLRPGARELLAELAAAGTKLGCVTNGGVRAQRAKLDHLEVTPYFDAIVISDAVGCAKPDPRIFAIASERLDVLPSETWFVGDHAVNDVIGSRRYGMRAVWICAGQAWPSGEPAPAHQIAELAELRELFIACEQTDAERSPARRA
jgi:putative hydrolase of the HAD superfamily